MGEILCVGPSGVACSARVEMENHVNSQLLAEAGVQSWYDNGWQFFADGGLFMVLLAITSVVAVAVIGFKFLTLTRGRIVPRALEGKIARIGERSAGNDSMAGVSVAAREGRSTLARLCAVALLRREGGIEAASEAVQSNAREEILRMQVGIAMLEVVITIAPLLGLLGTASGLVVVFGGLGETADHVAIARGIGRALNTTIVGLAIALPCVIAHSYFSRRIERLSARMEVLMGRLLVAVANP